MKFLHLSDLHLGKRVNDFSMIDDQKFILAQILNVIDEQKPDAVLIAGDIYDKGIPPVEAVELFDDFVTKLSKRKLPVFIISGNHDSAERLSFGSKLMELNGVYISPAYNGKIEPVVLNQNGEYDEFGPVNVYLLPFIKPSLVKPFFETEEIITYTDACRLAVNQMNIDKTQRNVLVAHQFVTGSERCDSEELSVGGADNVDAAVFEGFDYVALGHLHGPQKAGAENIRYSGTPLKYSFSEVNHKKGAGILEIGKKGELTYTNHQLTPKHEMRELRGSYYELTLKENYEGTQTEDYLHITLTDEEDIPEGFGRLQSVYKNLMKLDYDNTRTRNNSKLVNAEDIEAIPPIEHFKNFYKMRNGKPVSEEQEAILSKLIEKIWEGEK